MSNPFHTALWEALRSGNPEGALSLIVLEWKSNGVTKEQAEAYLLEFLDAVIEAAKPGEEDEGDPVRDTLDGVCGWCAFKSRLY